MKCKCGQPLTSKSKICRKCRREYDAMRDKLFPWIRHYEYAQNRCLYKSTGDAYLRYGAKGILFLLTIQQTKELWLRDRAGDLDKPSLDRIDAAGSYEPGNCQFVESRYNFSRKRTNKFDYRMIDRLWFLFRSGKSIRASARDIGMCDTYAQKIISGKVRPHERFYQKGKYPLDVYRSERGGERG